MSYSGHFGGAERILLDVATCLDRPAGIVCPPGALAERSADTGLTVMTVRPRRLELRASTRDRVAAAPRLAAQAMEVRRRLVAARPAVVVGWNMRGAMVAAAARTRGARFVFQHNDLVPGAAVARAVRAVAARADAVVALSRAIAEDLDPAGSIGVRVAHPGVDLASFTPRERRAAAPPTALLLGAIVPWKRPDLALEALSLARRRRPDLRLAIAGAPLDDRGRRLLEHLEARAAARDLAGAVDFLGPLADPRGALGAASVLLHCSDAEPFGMAMVESLACGVPVVAPAAGGPLEIVAPDCGALYPPGCPAAAADALIGVLERAAGGEPLAAAARARAEAAFDLDVARRRWRAAAGVG